MIVARVYFTGKPGTFTAEALQDHGTHVSGTIAGVNGTTAPAKGKTPAVTGLTGVAPKAFLGNYNVFPGPTANATSHDIAQAIEDPVKDGMDVINMSLGGGIRGFQDQLTVATNRAAKAGVVVAVAAGNSGPGVNTVESPGQAADAITACASTNNHFFGINVAAGGTTPRRSPHSLPTGTAAPPEQHRGRPPRPARPSQPVRTRARSWSSTAGPAPSRRRSATRATPAPWAYWW